MMTKELKDFPRDLNKKEAQEWLSHNVEKITELFRRAKKMADHYGLDLVLDFVEDGEYAADEDDEWDSSSCSADEDWDSSSC